MRILGKDQKKKESIILLRNSLNITETDHSGHLYFYFFPLRVACFLVAFQQGAQTRMPSAARRGTAGKQTWGLGLG